MEQRRPSPTSDAPEAVHGQHGTNFGFVGSDAYEYYEPPPSAFERQRSPVPEYQQYETSPRISAQSPPPASSDIGRSPPLSDSGFTKSRPLSPSVQYSEIHSPDPERVYNEGEKEAVYTHDAHQSKVPSYYAGVTPMPGIQHQNSGDRPQVWDNGQQHEHEHVAQEQKKKKKPFYKRWWCLLLLLLILAIAIAVPVGVVFGTKKSSSKSTASSSPTTAGNGTTANNPGVDLNTSIGGEINNAFYSKAGAWNGSGIAISGANPNENQAIYAFYQDYLGTIQYALMKPDQSWTNIGPVNDGGYKALNGTPLSAVLHYLGAELVWHLFYIDQNYYIRERIITNETSNGPAVAWSEGSISAKNFKTWESNSIGLQACYWGNYYGSWSYNATQASAGIHMWYASDATTFQLYNWENGTQDWNHIRQFPNLNGNAGVGCQTWDTGLTEYVWFVDSTNSISMYWQDNNRSATATTSHPIGAWTAVDIGIHNVQQDSSLGYTNYAVYQAQDQSIRGANITWGAENTTIASGSDANGKDTFVIQKNGQNVKAVRGTHLSFTAVTLAGGAGASLLAFFQEVGNDVAMYTRGALNFGGLWATAPQDPVAAS